MKVITEPQNPRNAQIATLALPAPYPSQIIILGDGKTQVKKDISETEPITPSP